MIPKASKVLTPAQYGAVAPPGDQWPLNDGDRRQYGINRIYPTLQGEGGQAGTPMTIVRLQGCPVGCLFCDTPESWEPNKITWWSAEAIAAHVKEYTPLWALVTGGEPTWYDLDKLTAGLHLVELKCALETSGVYQITGRWDYITISPKLAGRLPLVQENLYIADEVKWVIGRRQDIEYVEEQYEQWRWTLLYRYGRRPSPRWSLQPMSASEKATQLCLDALMKWPEWHLSLQVHKILGVA